MTPAESAAAAAITTTTRPIRTKLALTLAGYGALELVTCVIAPLIGSTPISLSRALDRSLVGVHQAAFREWSGRIFNVIMRIATGLPFRDTQCGFKLFRKDAAEVIFSRQLLEGFGFDVEDLLIARIHGFKVVEVPVRWDNVEGTKVGALTGARAFWDLAVVRWNQACGRYR